MILSPLTIITGKEALCYDKHSKVPFGSCTQISNGNDNTTRKQND